MKAWMKDKLLDVWDDIRRAHKSWTVWFNAVVMPALAACWPQVWDAFPQLSGVLPTEKYQTLLAVGTVVNILLRFRTDRALKNK